MNALRPTLAILLIGCALPAAAASSISTTLMAPFVSVLGVTKPTGSALDGRRGTSERLDRLSRELERRIEHGICVGCR